MLLRERLRSLNQPALELSKTPALIVLRAGRITVDAREKDSKDMMPHLGY
jgi:hypothetical protein